MKPTLSHLNCLGYWVTELSVKANPAMDPGQPVELTFDDLDIEADSSLDKEGKAWTTCLRIRQQIPPGRNAPYDFTLTMIGRFQVADDYRGKSEWLVGTNAPAVLFGAAREVLRLAMGTGPHAPTLLPAISFYQAPNHEATTPSAAGETTPQKTRRRPGKSGKP